MTKEKKCTKCGEVKGLECFSKDKQKRDGFRVKCKSCIKEYSRKYYQERPDVCAKREGVKTCTSCKEVKGVELFSKHKSKPDGLHSECKSCVKEYSRKYRQENKGRRKDYYKNYYEKNQNAMRAKVQKWAKENPDKNRAKAAKRRSRKHNATPDLLTEDQDLKIKLYYKIAKALEKMDGVKRHVDHIVPLKGKGVRGLHVPWNLQILTAEQNISKNNSYSDWD